MITITYNDNDIFCDLDYYCYFHFITHVQNWVICYFHQEKGVEIFPIFWQIPTWDLLNGNNIWRFSDHCAWYPVPPFTATTTKGETATPHFLLRGRPDTCRDCACTWTFNFRSLCHWRSRPVVPGGSRLAAKVASLLPRPQFDISHVTHLPNDGRFQG